MGLNQTNKACSLRSVSVCMLFGTLKTEVFFFYHLCLFGCAFVCFLYEEGEGEGEVSVQRGTNLLLGNSPTKIT